MTVFTISYVDIGSWDDILHLYQLTDTDFVSPLSQRPIDAEKMMRGVFQEGGYLGGYVTEKLVACVGYMKIGTRQAEIHGMVVLPEYRGKGFGKQLTMKLVQHLRKRGFHYVEVTTWENSLSQIMFQSLGFKKEKVFPDPLKRPDGINSVKLIKSLE